MQLNGPVMLGIAIVCLIGGLVIFYLTRDLRIRSPEHCASSMRLRPVLIPGPPWQHHRHVLVGTTPFNGSEYAIVNLRTGNAYAWAFRGHSERSQPVFSVQTRWVLLNPGWANDQWQLVYDCDVSTES